MSLPAIMKLTKKDATVEMMRSYCRTLPLHGLGRFIRRGDDVVPLLQHSYIHNYLRQVDR